MNQWIGNLKFFCTIDINEMAAIFNFFIMADAGILFLLTLRKPETQTLGGVSNLKFFCMIDIDEMAAIFQFFIRADADIPFPLTLGKPKTQTLGHR